MWRRVKAFHESGFCEGGERGASCGEGTYQLLPCESRFTNPEVRSESVSHSVVSESLRPHKDCGLPRSSVAWNSPGKNTGEGSHSLFQGIFPTQGWNPGFLYCRQMLYILSHLILKALLILKFPQIADFKSYIVYVAILKSVGLGSRLQTNENKSFGLGLWVQMWAQRVNKQLEHLGIS